MVVLFSRIPFMQWAACAFTNSERVRGCALLGQTQGVSCAELGGCGIPLGVDSENAQLCSRWRRGVVHAAREKRQLRPPLPTSGCAITPRSTREIAHSLHFSPKRSRSVCQMNKRGGPASNVARLHNPTARVIGIPLFEPRLMYVWQAGISRISQRALI